MRLISASLYDQKEYDNFYEFAKQSFNYDVKSEREVLIILKQERVLRGLRYLASRSLETYQHSIKVAILSSYIARQCGLKKQDRDLLTTGALLHDLGKAKLPDYLLSKIGKLTDDEWGLIKSHPMEGYKLIRKSFPKEVCEIALLHHKKIDGGGYPKADLSPSPLCQIVTTADIYDALTSLRSYKRPISHSNAMDILKREAREGGLVQEYVDIIDSYKRQTK